MGIHASHKHLKVLSLKLLTSLEFSESFHRHWKNSFLPGRFEMHGARGERPAECITKPRARRFGSFSMKPPALKTTSAPSFVVSNYVEYTEQNNQL